jgi:hypothetical protein
VDAPAGSVNEEGKEWARLMFEERRDRLSWRRASWLHGLDGEYQASRAGRLDAILTSST